MKTALAIAMTLSAGISLTEPAHAQADDGKLGTVNFETSCKPEAKKLFNQGMLYQHSFWYRASQNVFEDVLKADPQCGIAYWGIALSLLYNPHVAPPAKNLAACNFAADVEIACKFRNPAGWRRGGQFSGRFLSVAIAGPAPS